MNTILLILAVSSILELKKAVWFISRKAGFAKDVNEVVKPHQHVEVKVTEVDEDRKRIQLTMVI
jgi:transcriptional accessory protein Tex/SPT6